MTTDQLTQMLEESGYLHRMGLAYRAHADWLDAHPDDGDGLFRAEAEYYRAAAWRVLQLALDMRNEAEALAESLFPAEPEE